MTFIAFQGTGNLLTFYSVPGNAESIETDSGLFSFIETPKIIPKLVMAARYQFVIFVVWFVAFPIKGATSWFAKKHFSQVYLEKTVLYHIELSLFVR